MLAKFFDIFEPTERQFTAKSLRRLKWTTFAAMPCLPLMTILEANPSLNLSKSASDVLVILMLISAIAFLVMAFNRITWRVWAPDQYLDESEIARKREASAFTMMVYGWGGLAVLILGGVLLLSGIDLNAFMNRFGGPVWWVFLGLTVISFVHVVKLISITPAIEDPESEIRSVFKDKIYLWVLAVFLIAITVVPFAKGYHDGHQAALAEIEAAKQFQMHQDNSANSDE